MAVDHLRACGYAILDRNWRGVRVEVDVVARAGDTIVFCEVKARRGRSRGLPAEAVSETKLSHMRSAAMQWLAVSNIRHHGVRLDVIAVEFAADGSHELTHLEGVGQ